VKQLTRDAGKLAPDKLTETLLKNDDYVSCFGQQTWLARGRRLKTDFQFGDSRNLRLRCVAAVGKANVHGAH
jgi:hypothetical protein